MAKVRMFGAVLMVAATVAACSSTQGTGSNTQASSSPAEAASSSAATANETFTVATTVPFPPYTDNVNGEFVGIEKDLITAIAKADGFSIIIENAPKFEALLPGMLSGRYDGAYDAFGDNPDRHEAFKTIDWLGYRWSLAAIDGKFSDTSELCGKRVTLQAGSATMIDAIQKYSDDTCAGAAIEQVPLPIGQQASAVRSGRAEAMMTDSISMPGLLEENVDFTVVGGPFGEQVIGGLLVPTSNADFADRVVRGLKTIIEDGTYDQIMTKWDVADASYKKATVNLQ